ncbi:hypothetical protein [Stenotrophomonas rhizophila]|uniref:hypothetical protein n=1 Tax=Stenotrophomonas rhizophila TaxID=216778 RepID=UPI000456A71D|nr:hypothetical protein [Stenotrophomonas rhizophila]AHY60966.1 hypothetical protein DX03_20235 [Stenotrophomonas rhizophila]
MPLINVSTKEVMSLDSFCNWVDAQDPQRLQNIGQWPELWERLYALHNTQNLVSRFLKEQLNDDLALFQQDNRYSGQTLILARRRGFYLRVNLWPSANDELARLDLQNFNKFYVYGDRYAHDHNFDFLTIGLHGPGYQTDLWTYDNTGVTGSIGEKVLLTAHGRQRLAPGTMLLFRKSVDIHTQLAPESLSVSLNFIPEVSPISEQYLFDVHTGRIASIEDLFPRARNMEVLVSELGDAGVTDAFQKMTHERELQVQARKKQRADDARKHDTSGEPKL